MCGFSQIQVCNNSNYCFCYHSLKTQIMQIRILKKFLFSEKDPLILSEKR